ncbi:MAG: hypothetical protein II094_07045 [Oscillospiraceae bacterium]|nr:hypothetical protein [Oscillospiraceae bacterium]MBQ5442353.1 hypothetical protein [Oscillospiraceae bacterium]
MEKRLFRVSLALEREAQPEQVLAALEEALARRIRPVWQLKGAHVISLWLSAAELEIARSVRGVRSAQMEQRAELPHPPRAKPMER